jgi:hypothetical protein
LSISDRASCRPGCCPILTGTSILQTASILEATSILHGLRSALPTCIAACITIQITIRLAVSGAGCLSAAELFAIGHIALLVQFLARAVTTLVGGVAAMDGVVIPACVAGIDIKAIVDVDAVEVIDIDIDAATAPVEPTPERIGHTDAHTPCNAGRNRA